MPPSAQRRRTRKQPDPVDKSDPDDVEELATPNRKRRRVGRPPVVVQHSQATKPTNCAKTNNSQYAQSDVAQPTRTAAKKDRLSNIKVYEDDSSFTEDDLNAVINNLREARRPIAASVDLSNEVQELKNPEGKTAYAKIAGNGWTFYVDELQVRIGRPPDERYPGEANGDAASTTSQDHAKVHIDLGPSKLVSRQHAEICFNNQYATWEIFVNGRNGLRLDERALARGDRQALHSGSVVEIAGTQMIFITPNDEPEVCPSVRAQARAAQEEDDDEDETDLMGPPPQPHRTPTRGNGGRSSGQRPGAAPSSSNHKQAQNGPADSSHASYFSQQDNSTDVPSSVPRNGTPGFSRGLMLESADDIDYSADSAKDLKPPHSYAQLIGMAILSTEEEKLTLAKIYDWIKERYAFYRLSNGGWQNSIRHNLSLNKSFEKVARRTDEPGKGMKWQIAPEHREEFIKKGLSGARRPAGRTSSVPASPSKDLESSYATSMDHAFARDSKDHSDVKSTPKLSYGFKASPGSTPPVSHYNQVKQAYTPERAPYASGTFEASSPVKHFGTGVSPFPFSSKARDRWGGMTEAAAAGTPGGPRISFGSEPQEPNLVTPLITKHAPKLAPPSTARLPSHYMALSSPAPFWKYADFSTPAKPLITSPVKADMKGLGRKEESDEEKMEEKKPSMQDEPMVRSSSPPLPDGELGQGSPTRAMSQRDHKFGGAPPVAFQPKASAPVGAPTKRDGTVSPVKPSIAPVVAANQEDDEDEDEEECVIDLARGFQPIGSFHRNLSAGIVGRN